MTNRAPDELDAIRGTAALVVAAAHYVQVWVVPSVGYLSLTSEITGLAATYAVNIFFVLSGFVIALSVIRHQREDGSFRFLEFLTARALRLLAPYYFAILLSIGIVAFVHFAGLYGAASYRLPSDVDIVRENASINRRELIWSALLFYGIIENVGRPLYFNGPLWSVGIEWCLYIISAVGCHAWFNRKISAGIGFALAVLLLLLFGDPVFLKFAIVWVCGFALAFLISGKCRISGKQAAISCFVSVGAILMLERQHLWQSMLDRSAASIVGSGAAFAFVIAWRASAINRSPSWFVLLLSPSANWSYTLYLIHFPILLLGFSLTRPLAHQFGAIGEYLCGMVWLLVTILAASKIGPIVENRQALRGWIERSIARSAFRLKAR
jgi:peptidoglycan/LPS O-acetylase OafA/YrhL